MVHRQIRQIIATKVRSNTQSDFNPHDLDPVTPEGVDMNEVAQHCSMTERRAEEASRDVIAWLKAEYMQDKVGQQYQGTISSVREFGIFVQLDEIFVDGMIHVSQLGQDYYEFDPKHYQLIGERTAQRFRMGMKLTIEVAGVNLDQSKIDFSLIEIHDPLEMIEPQSSKAEAKSKAKAKKKSKTVRKESASNAHVKKKRTNKSGKTNKKKKKNKSIS